jgi:hypothetical protein
MIGINRQNISRAVGILRYAVKKPVVTKAIRMHDDFFVETDHGRVSGKKGDYLLQSVTGDLSVMSSEAFESNYDFLENQNVGPEIPCDST